MAVQGRNISAGRIPVSLQRLVDDAHGVLDLGLQAPQQPRVDVLGQEGVDLGLELETDLAQGRGRGCAQCCVDDGAVGVTRGRSAVGGMVVKHRE